MLNNEQIHNVLFAIKEHPDRDAIMERLEDVILAELELNVPRLIDAVLMGDADGVIHAFTGWDLQALLENAMIIPRLSCAWSAGTVVDAHQNETVFQSDCWHGDA